MTAPSLSVVMPVHNGMPYVEQSVLSLLRQSYRDFELVIGDDGSTDGTGAVLQCLTAADPRIRLLRREGKSGLSASANWVVSNARAPFVAIAHADDLYHPDRLALQMEAIGEAADIALVGAFSEGMDASGRYVQPANLYAALRSSPLAPFTHSTVLFRKSGFDRVGGYREGADLWKDLDLYWRLRETGRVIVLPHVLARYRHSPVSSREREQHKAELSLHKMYRAAALYRSHQDYDRLLDEDATDAARPLPPRIFVARSWVRVWQGKRPGLFLRMLRRAHLRLDFASVEALAFLAWATASPKSLRLALRLLAGARNRVVRRKLAGIRSFEWQPRPDRGEADAAARL